MNFFFFLYLFGLFLLSSLLLSLQINHIKKKRKKILKIAQRELICARTEGKIKSNEKRKFKQIEVALKYMKKIYIYQVFVMCS